MHPAGSALDLDALIGVPIEPVRLSLDDLDAAIDPAVDLDGFVNARWRARNPPPPDRGAWDCFAVLHERSLQVQARIAATCAATPRGTDVERLVGDLWASGMQRDENAPVDGLREELRRIGHLESPAAIACYLCERHARGWPLLFDFEVDAAFDDPQQPIACISQGGLGLPDCGHYRDPATAGMREAYLALIASLLAWSGDDATIAHERAVGVVAFEARLAAVSTPRATLARDIAQRQRRVAMREIDAVGGPFRWSSFFAAAGIQAPAEFSLAMPDFHTEWRSMLDDTSADTWRAYFAVHTIAGMAEALGGEPGRCLHRFRGETLRGQRTAPPRWKRVLATLEALAGEALGELYVGHAFSDAARTRAEELAERLRAALRRRIDQLDWMGVETKAHARRKLEAMRAKIGHPHHWPDWSTLTTSPWDWFGNLLALRAFQQQRKLDRLDRPVDREVWRMTPQTVNAGYDPLRNEVVFPAAILQPPFFDPDADDPINYGGIGAVIAHEMTHGFDDQGSRFDADGRLRNWWTPQDRARFEERARQLVALFDAAKGIDGAPVDGRLTLGENIADLGGLAIACDAMKARLEDFAETPGIAVDGHASLRRFFLAWATIWRHSSTPAEAHLRLKVDPHAPAALRATVAPSQMREFALAFPSAQADATEARDGVRIW